MVWLLIKCSAVVVTGGRISQRPEILSNSRLTSLQYIFLVNIAIPSALGGMCGITKYPGYGRGVPFSAFYFSG